MKDLNAWKRGMRMLERGFYVDPRGAVHIDTAELLQAKGLPVTPENEEVMYRELRDRFRKPRVTSVDERPIV